MHMAMLLAAVARGWQLLSKACLLLVPLGKGWGLHSRKWIRQDRTRSPRASGAQAGHEGGQSHAETREADFRRYVSGLYMENEVVSTVS